MKILMKKLNIPYIHTYQYMYILLVCVYCPEKLLLTHENIYFNRLNPMSDLIQFLSMTVDLM